MAKTGKAGNKATVTVPSEKKPPRCDFDREAAAILIDVMVTFHEGFGKMPDYDGKAKDYFISMLFTSSWRNLARGILTWDQDTKDQVLPAAKKHGVYARAEQGGAPKLTLAMILTSLEKTKDEMCPRNRPGIRGAVCDF